MSDYVVDTNVWVMVDFDISKATTHELNSVECCKNWLRNDLLSSPNKLVVDLDYRILKEYRGKIRKAGLARQWLNQLETKPRDRLIELQIEYDENSDAVLPPEVAVDRTDRKFVAVALAHKPTPPIVEATDTDWEKAKPMLNAAGIHILELCPAYIQSKLK